VTRPKEFFEGTEMPTAGWWEALWPDPAGVLRSVGVGAPMDVADLCSGDGWFTLQIAKIARRVVAIDIDAALIDVARKRLSEARITNCEYVVGDASKLSNLLKQPIDFVFMANAFHGVPNKGQLARSVYDVLKPTGKFAIVNWHVHPREETQVLGEPRGPRTDLRMSPDETIRAVMPSGLEPVDVVEVPPYHYGAVFQRPV